MLCRGTRTSWARRGRNKPGLARGQLGWVVGGGGRRQSSGRRQGDAAGGGVQGLVLHSLILGQSPQARRPTRPSQANKGQGFLTHAFWKLSPGHPASVTTPPKKLHVDERISNMQHDSPVARHTLDNHRPPSCTTCTGQWYGSSPDQRARMIPAASLPSQVLGLLIT